MVWPRRLELPRVAPQAPQACVSTNSTMATTGRYYIRLLKENQAQPAPCHLPTTNKLWCGFIKNSSHSYNLLNLLDNNAYNLPHLVL